MINANDIRHRMDAIMETRQITRAMYLLSTTKVKRDTAWIALTRTYFTRVLATMRDILEKSQGTAHRYMEIRQGGRAAFIVIAGDKGLCGGYNHSVLNFAQERARQYEDPLIIAVGQMTRAFFEPRGYRVETEFLFAGQRPYLRHARRIVDYGFELFDAGELDEIFVVFTRHGAAASGKPDILRLLPIVLDDFAEVAPEYEYTADMIYEPSAQEVFDTLVPEYAIGLLFGSMVQSYISEHTARLVAMESATDNADKMIESLKLQYNTARQYAITREIAEIIGAAEAVPIQNL